MESTRSIYPSIAFPNLLLFFYVHTIFSKLQSSTEGNENSVLLQFVFFFRSPEVPPGPELEADATLLSTHLSNVDSGLTLLSLKEISPPSTPKNPRELQTSTKVVEIFKCNLQNPPVK